jgi:hypothetical protein
VVSAAHDPKAIQHAVDAAYTTTSRKAVIAAVGGPAKRKVIE